MTQRLFALACLIFCTFGANASTSDQINRLEARMLSLKKQLSQDETARDKLYTKLAKTEKKISHDLHALHLLTPKEKQKKQEIQAITERIDALNQQLKTQEQILKIHLRSRHKLGAIHPWQWLLNQETPRAMSRLFVFYRYLFKADQQVIDNIRKTHTRLSKTRTALSLEEKNLSALQAKLAQRQKRLIQMKKEQQALIKTLSLQIKTQSEQLATFNHDKARLQSLIRKLNVSTQKKSTSPRIKLAGKPLNSPLDVPSKQIKPLNQGLVLMANEGTPVVAVLPGKVIFSDWLKGYGLLLIIDHGDGIMSLYAHNSSLFKTLGSLVKQGEQIATVGHTGGLRENGLYFEVRRRGRAVPPREWMS